MPFAQDLRNHGVCVPIIAVVLAGGGTQVGSASAAGPSACPKAPAVREVLREGTTTVYRGPRGVAKFLCVAGRPGDARRIVKLDRPFDQTAVLPPPAMAINGDLMVTAYYQEDGTAYGPEISGVSVHRLSSRPGQRTRTTVNSYDLGLDGGLIAKAVVRKDGAFAATTCDGAYDTLSPPLGLNSDCRQTASSMPRLVLARVPGGEPQILGRGRFIAPLSVRFDASGVSWLQGERRKLAVLP